MGRQNVSLLSFNHGKISPQGLARTDLDRTKLSAEIQTNYIPKVLGPMTIRPGLGFIGSTYQNKKAFHIPFVAATDDTALLELTDMNLRVRISDTIVTRNSVSTAFTNGTFNTDLSSWTDNDQSGAASVWVTGGYMGLTGTSFNSAIRRQTLSVSSPDQNVEHGLRIIVTKGIVHVKIGTTSGGNDLLPDTLLYPGTHSLTFTPTTSTAFVQLNANTKYQSLVDSIAIEASGDMVIPTIWPEASLFSLRYAQSIDVTFVACYGFRPQRVERHGPKAWSVVDYFTQDGPFQVQNVSDISMTVGALSGDTTLTSSQPYFTSANVGSLFSITSVGQTVTSVLNGDGQYTNFIRVIGVGTSRNFTITRSGTWAGTLTVQRSLTDDSSPADTTTTFTTNGSTVFNDALDNEIAYYRVGFDTGKYTSGDATVTLTYSSGSLIGVAKVTSYTNQTTVNISVLTDMGGTSASSTWSEGLWSNRRGFPSAVGFYEGRLWWAGKGTIVGSVSDAFDSFDPAIIGDSGVINRTIGEGPIDRINFLLPIQRLICGGQGNEFSIRSSAFDEIITPSNLNIKAISTQGSENIAAVKVDINGIYVQQGGTRLFEFSYNSDIFDYQVDELTTLVPEELIVGVTKLAVQRKLDTRIHCVLSDGTVGLLVYDKGEEIEAWVDVVSDGAGGVIEDVVILPGTIEDVVYYVVKRTIDSSVVRYLEKWALETECHPAQGSTDLCKIADSFIVYDSTPTTTITGLDSLEGEEVVVWADGKDAGTATVASGQITLAVAASKVVVGLYYKAQFKSTKLAYAAEGGTAINMYKRIPQLGLVLINTHIFGVKYGEDFDNLKAMPRVQGGKDVGVDYIFAAYDDQQFACGGRWDTDSRLCLQSEAPKPATILCTTLTVETNG